MQHVREKSVAVVSGGEGYLGSAIGRALTEKGWKVFSLGRHAKGEDSYQCDVTSEDEVRECIERITNQHGSIRACIHAATAGLEKKPLLTLDAVSFDASLAVAVRGAFLLAKFALEHMHEDSAFIGITTKLIERGVSLPPTGSYVTGKYALRGFLRSLSVEARPQKIRVYAVAPGFLPEGLNRDTPAPIVSLLAKKSGAGRSDVEEVAALVTRLCIERDAYPAGSSITLSPIKCDPL